jgi:hypothetical protein
MADSEKLRCSTPPILNHFSWKFQGLILGLVGLIDVKGLTYLAVRLSDITTKIAFLPLFWGYVKQPDDHISWASLLPFASIYPTNTRTNPWTFQEKMLRIGGVENLSFFESAILNLFFKKTTFFWASSLFKSVAIYGIPRLGQKCYD